ncbi:hypothetical protein [Streptomyces sp. NPDC057939]|uniref:hypothetical protein n=1 Tax=Streptomyces sp. NPDC057939 TaxID=3346284 RepID=UPI0036EABC59
MGMLDKPRAMSEIDASAKDQMIQVLERAGLPSIVAKAAGGKAAVVSGDGGMGGIGGLDVSPKAKAGVSAEAAVPGTGLLASGSSKAKFGEGVDLGVRLETGGAGKRSGQDPGEPDGAEKESDEADDVDAHAAADADRELLPDRFDPYAGLDGRMNTRLTPESLGLVGFHNTSESLAATAPAELDPRPLAPSMSGPGGPAAIRSFITKALLS